MLQIEQKPGSQESSELYSSHGAQKYFSVTLGMLVFVYSFSLTAHRMINGALSKIGNPDEGLIDSNKFLKDVI